MAKSLGLAKVPTLDPKGEQEYPSYEYVRALARALDSNFEILNYAFGSTQSSLNLLLNASAASSINTNQSTNSATPVNLGTVGPEVSVETGTHALVVLSSSVENTVADSGGAISCEVSGATTIPVDSINEMEALCSAANRRTNCAGTFLFTTLTPGVNTFTLKYRAHWGGIAAFSNRRIAVIPLK